MIYGSVCSGIEAATVAWEPLGWEPAWFCEFEKFPSAVLSYHYPDIPNLGDMTKIEKRSEYRDRSIDLLVGGTPCQSFSIAGLRQGLDDDRGNLALKFCEILRDKQPQWFVWENVPGVLSSDEGRDFATILSGFRECGYQFAYRILDAQYFGVAQRRRRLFVVGYLGDWRPPAAVLFERESLHRNPAPSREKREGVASFTPSGFGKYSEGVGTLRAEGGDLGGGSENLVASRMVAFGEYVDDNTASTIKERDYKDSTDLVTVHGTQDPGVLEDKAHTLGRNNGQENALCYPINTQVAMRHKKLGEGTGLGIGKEADPAYTLQAAHHHAVCFQQNADGELRESDQAYTLNTNSNASGRNTGLLRNDMAVRRLTPIECERLQGFPDSYSRIPWRGKEEKYCPDGPRYKALGNSMARPVMYWIGKRIDIVHNLLT